MNNRKPIVRKGHVKWHSMKDQKPEINQKVFYFFVVLGTYRGVYSEQNCFSGDYGFLCDDVTHWAPDNDINVDVPKAPIFTDEELRNNSAALFGFTLDDESIEKYKLNGRI